MGLWTWLFGKADSVNVGDLIWLTTAAKLRGLREEVVSRAPVSPLVLVVAQFPKTLAEVEDQLERADIEFTAHEGKFTRLDAVGQKRVITLLAESLQAQEYPDPIDENAEGPVILVAERHLLRAHDDHVVDFARGLSVPCRVRFYLSLDDPLMRLFAGSSIKPLLVHLGMTESSPINSSSVARRVRAAQGKLAQQPWRDERADSAEDWLRQNE